MIRFRQKTISALAAYVLVFQSPALSAGFQDQAIPWEQSSVLQGTNLKPWSSQMDLMSAGAAASVVLHYGCIDQTATDAAAKNAAQRLQAVALRAGDPEAAYMYASNSFDQKVKAMWQSTSGECRKMQRLRDIAKSTGFAVPLQ